MWIVYLQTSCSFTYALHICKCVVCQWMRCIFMNDFFSPSQTTGCMCVVSVWSSASCLQVVSTCQCFYTLRKWTASSMQMKTRVRHLVNASSASIVVRSLRHRHTVLHTTTTPCWSTTSPWLRSRLPRLGSCDRRHSQQGRRQTFLGDCSGTDFALLSSSGVSAQKHGKPSWEFSWYHKQSLDDGAVSTAMNLRWGNGHGTVMDTVYWKDESKKIACLKQLVWRQSRNTDYAVSLQVLVGLLTGLSYNFVSMRLRTKCFFHIQPSK